MRTRTRTALVAWGVVPVAMAAATPALAMPTGVGSAQDVVRTLEADGVQVVLNPVGRPLGATPLDRCTVSAVRPVPVESQPHTTVFVDITC